MGGNTMSDPAKTKETPSQEADRIYAEQHPEKPEAQGEVLTLGELEAAIHRLDIDHSASDAMKILAHDAALHAALKKAEEVIKTLTIADDRHFDEMSKRGHRADTAEAKLKKAEEERDAQTRCADVTLAKMCDARDAVVVALSKAEEEIETWKNADISRTLRAHAEYEAEELAAMLTTTTHRADAAEARIETLADALRHLHDECKSIREHSGKRLLPHPLTMREAAAAMKEKP
jgi:hypothetical protein